MSPSRTRVWAAHRGGSSNILEESLGHAPRATSRATSRKACAMSLHRSRARGRCCDVAQGGCDVATSPRARENVAGVGAPHRATSPHRPRDIPRGPRRHRTWPLRCRMRRRRESHATSHPRRTTSPHRKTALKVILCFNADWHGSLMSRTLTSFTNSIHLQRPLQLTVLGLLADGKFSQTPLPVCEVLAREVVNCAAVHK